VAQLSGLFATSLGIASVIGTKRKCRNGGVISGAGGRPAVPSAFWPQPPLTLRGRFEIGCQACSSSSSALASFKESVSKPSVNQP
jgi:hypothetical protein